MIQSPGTPYNLTAIYCLDTNNAIAVGENGVVYVTTNGGASWELFSIGTVTNLLDVTVLNCVGYITGEDGNVYTFQFPGCSPNLPVELIDFNVLEISGKVLIEWITEVEIDNDYFEVQRSTDGSRFDGIGILESQGNSDSRTSYQHIDPLPRFGLNYYRLKQVDLDGTITFSEVKVIEIKPGENSVIVYPTLVSNSIKVELQSSSDRGVRIFVSDVAGRVLLHENHLAEAGVFHIELTLDELPTGVYFLTVADEYGRETVELLKIDE